jgi:hypothetical protein
MTEHPVRGVYPLQLERRIDGWRHVSDEKEATHAIILIRHGPYQTDLVFEMGDTEQSRRNALYGREQVERLLALAYDAGDRAARADIRRALGVAEPRR